MTEKMQPHLLPNQNMDFNAFFFSFYHLTIWKWLGVGHICYQNDVPPRFFYKEGIGHTSNPVLHLMDSKINKPLFIK